MILTFAFITFFQTDLTNYIMIELTCFQRCKRLHEIEFRRWLMLNHYIYNIDINFTNLMLTMLIQMLQPNLTKRKPI